MTTAILNNGLEEIGKWAFSGCALVLIDIPPSVKAIKEGAFQHCSDLTTVTLNDGLEVIGEEAFQGCALERIMIPPSVRSIRGGAFEGCSGLTTAILNDGLEEIGGRVFKGCALVHIDIPPAVRAIKNGAFCECLNLTTVMFCDEIEEFVSSGSMRDWWNQGVHEKCLSTYCFLVQFNIPQCLGLASTQWQEHIHGMLLRIPSVSNHGLDSYLHSINFKLFVYENFIDTSTLLNLAIWKSKITEQTKGNIDLLTPNKKMKCRINSLSMVEIIVPNVHSFLRRVFFTCTGHSNQVLPRNVTDVRVHHSVEVIEQKTFEGCEWLAVLDLGKGLRVIRRWVFAYCSSLEHIVVPPTVRAINARAFEYCSQLTTVQLCEGLEKIGKGAFRGCTNLRAVLIPSSVTVIDKDAFDSSTQLKTVKLWGWRYNY